MPPSVTSVSLVSGKLGLVSVSHTLNNSCDLVLRDQHRYLLQHCIERLGVSWCHYYALDPHRHVKIVDTSDERTVTSQSAQDCFADSSEVCSGIVILGLVLSLVFAQKGRTTDLNTPSMYNWLIKCPFITTRSVVLGFKHLHLPRDLPNVNVWKPMVAP